MADLDPSVNQIVEEFPPPPAYYKNSASLTPPPIPDTDPYLLAYNGLFSNITQGRPVYDDSKDYKAVLKGYLVKQINVECFKIILFFAVI